MNSSQVAFQVLHPDVQRVVYRLGWSALRPIQVATIEAFYESKADLLLISPTASGKTEAWLLPTLSVLLRDRLPSVQAMCISPLKALINDQTARITRIAEPLNIKVLGWHGDVSQHLKQALRKSPEGILIVTPESTEAAIMNRPGEVAKMFKHLEVVIIDEVHALLEQERGIHVRSLLFRLFDLIESRPRLVGLSATIGEPQAAASFLNPENPDSVKILGL
jgi:ATP-dependent Lhr-like helicase